jgi:hypothetical protein
VSLELIRELKRESARGHNLMFLYAILLYVENIFNLKNVRIKRTWKNEWVGKWVGMCDLFRVVN